MHYQFAPRSVCSRLIDFDLDEQNKIHNLAFFSGCPGNLAAISKLLEGVDAQHAIDVLKGNTCGQRPTSCADQLSIALEGALSGELAPAGV